MKQITSSFRDPSGYVYQENDAIKRVVFSAYFNQYHQLSESKFYDLLFSKKYLIPHKEISKSDTEIHLEATKIPFITYPYEWSFLQYKHAALLTLKIQKLCLEHNFTLKDSSAFNITFFEGKPIFIDTLSFDLYIENQPWKAYKQFISHFFGPLVLSSYFGLDFLKSLSQHIDGIPIETIANLLPFRSKLNPTIFTNIHLLAKFEKKNSKSNKSESNQKLSKSAQIRLINSLYQFIENLEVNQKTEWDNYYNEINYKDVAYQLKKQFTTDWFSSLSGKKIIDVGGNDGTFSREIGTNAELILVGDIDPNAVGQNYKQILKNKEKNIIPFVLDVLNPAANIGFNNQERFGVIDRIESSNLDGCMALAIIHHLTLSGNIPFEFSADFFAKLAPSLLIEFPTEQDSWVQFLLESKRDFKDHFQFYNVENFENAYLKFFTIESKTEIKDSHRILYQMKRK